MNNNPLNEGMLFCSLKSDIKGKNQFYKEVIAVVSSVDLRGLDI